ncbi:helix-turn-helix transcriptional regulator [Streptomyces sp. NPDC002547]
MLSRKISGAKLRHVREDRCVEVADLAETVGCSRWTIYKIEQGKTQPSAKLYAALRSALAADEKELVDEAAGSAA